MNLRSGATLHRFAYGLERSGVAARLHDRQRFYLSVYMRSLPVLEKRLMDTWSWFRLIEAVASLINPSTGVAETTFDIDGNLMASQFDDTARSTSFAPRFYSRLRLPVLLSKTHAIKSTQSGV